MLFFDNKVFKVLLEQLHPHLDRHHVTEEDDQVIVLTQIKPESSTSSTTSKNGTPDKLVFPLQSPSDKVGEYKISPMIHAGYAFTWFGLSGAGMIMTRKLLTRGRG